MNKPKSSVLVIVLLVGILAGYFYLKRSSFYFKNLICIERISVDSNMKNSDAVMKIENIQNLDSVDATKLISEKSLGVYGGTQENPREIFKQLVQTQKIETFIHLSSNLCITKETIVGDDYTAFVSAEHYYCTSECITEDYKFEFGFNKKTKEVTVRANTQ